MEYRRGRIPEEYRRWRGRANSDADGFSSCEMSGTISECGGDQPAPPVGSNIVVV
jgi:hypothetical protein